MTPFEIRFVVGGSLTVSPPPGADSLPDLSLDGDVIVEQFKTDLEAYLRAELDVPGESDLKVDITAAYRPVLPTLVVPG